MHQFSNMKCRIGNMVEKEQGWELPIVNISPSEVKEIGWLLRSTTKLEPKYYIYCKILHEIMTN